MALSRRSAYKRGGASGRGKCPEGVLCMSNEWLIAFVIIGLAIAGLFIYNAGMYNANPVQLKGQQYNQQQYSQQNNNNNPIQPAINVNVSRGGDDRYTRAPEPLRIWDGTGAGLGFSTTSLPFNIPTQGYPPNFSSVGIIKTEDGQVLPLYGRPSTYGSDRYNYYTRTDTYNPVPLPVRFEKRDCMDDNGCQEVFNKDKVHISAIGKEATATIFKFDSPKYFPGV